MHESDQISRDTGKTVGPFTVRIWRKDIKGVIYVQNGEGNVCRLPSEKLAITFEKDD